MNDRFEGNNGHDADVTRCLLLTQSGHSCSLVTFVTADLLGNSTVEDGCRSGARCRTAGPHNGKRGQRSLWSKPRPCLWRLHEARIDEASVEGQDLAARLTTE